MPEYEDTIISEAEIEEHSLKDYSGVWLMGPTGEKEGAVVAQASLLRSRDGGPVESRQWAGNKRLFVKVDTVNDVVRQRIASAFNRK